METLIKLGEITESLKLPALCASAPSGARGKGDFPNTFDGRRGGGWVAREFKEEQRVTFSPLEKRRWQHGPHVS